MFELTKLYPGQIAKLSKAKLEKIKDAILGQDYSLSLVFSSRKLATEMHLKWKKQDGPANILSFPLDKSSGEIFIYPHDYRTPADLTELYIHGLVHLKGFTHSHAMDKEEKKWQDIFVDKK